jgi:hypothetical protein
VPELPDQETLNWALHTLITLLAQLREMAVRALGSQTPVMTYRIPGTQGFPCPLVVGVCRRPRLCAVVWSRGGEPTATLAYCVRASWGEHRRLRAVAGSLGGGKRDGYRPWHLPEALTPCFRPLLPNGGIPHPRHKRRHGTRARHRPRSRAGPGW